MPMGHSSWSWKYQKLVSLVDVLPATQVPAPTKQGPMSMVYALPGSMWMGGNAGNGPGAGWLLYVVWGPGQLPGL